MRRVIGIIIQERNVKHKIIILKYLLYLYLPLYHSRADLSSTISP